MEDRPIVKPHELTHLWNEARAGFPLYGLSIWWIVASVAALILIAVAYSFAGKGSGSHAGREQIRRAYRRELAKQMAKEDAVKIRNGEKPRRRWMQW